MLWGRLRPTRYNRSPFQVGHVASRKALPPVVLLAAFWMTEWLALTLDKTQGHMKHCSEDYRGLG